MKITKRQIRRIIKEEIVRSLNEYGNPPPPSDSNWNSFAKAIDVGVLDLDSIAYDLGFTNFHDMDQSITPRVLALRDPETFVTAVQNHALAGSDMGSDEIMDHATFSAPNASVTKRLRQRTRAQGGHSGRGAWKSRTPNK
jgi:hypothetical protein